jgi:MtN3 and saliva related transmembrane protein
MSMITIVGLVAAVFTTFSFVPQAIKIIKNRETKDISLLMYVTLDIGIFLWLVYGVLIKSMPVVVANGVTLIFTSVVLALKIKFG